MPAPESISVILPDHLKGVCLQSVPIEFTFDGNEAIYKGMINATGFPDGSWHVSIIYNRSAGGHTVMIPLSLPQNIVDGIQIGSETNPIAIATLPKELDRLPKP